MSNHLKKAVDPSIHVPEIDDPIAAFLGKIQMMFKISNECEMDWMDLALSSL